jgi:hypothetical protein
MWVEQTKEEGETAATNSNTRCSRCLHKGDRRSHKRQGCIECGTKGYCITAAPDERFRQSLKKKVQSCRERFVFLDNLIAHYKTSEGNSTVLATAANIEDQIFQCQNCIHRMVSALLMKNASTNHIVYGRSHATSRDFMWQSLSKIFARLHMLKLPETIVDGNVGQEYVDKIIELLYRATIIEEFVSNATLIGTKHNLDNRPDAGIYTPSISLKVVLDAVVCFTYVRPDSFLLLRTSL